MDFKVLLWTVVAVIIALISYDMFVKKVFKLDTYDTYESLEDNE